MRKFLGALITVIATLALAGAANAAPINSVFNGKLPCTVNSSTQVRECSGPGGGPDDPVVTNNAFERTVPSWDGTPIDVNVAFPDPGEFGDGPYPLVMYFHGFGGGKEGFGGDLKRFTDRGMAAFSMTERGFKFSCGKKNAIKTLIQPDPDGYGAGACNAGYIHLMDNRYEVRDAQYFAGLLADEGLVIPDRIASVGASYGGTKSMALATLRNRIMLPDGSLAPWKSPNNKQMEIAVAAPIVPPTDFGYSLVPNGTTLDYTVKNDYGPRNSDGTFAPGVKFGVMKAGIINGLFGAGDNFSGDFPDLGFTPTANWDVRAWKDMMSAGEPYGTGPNAATASLMLNEITAYHSSYYLDSSVAPAPLIIAEGFADDLFPVDEALRFYNKAKTERPNSNIGLLFADIGHPRAPLSGPASQGRDEDKELGFQRVEQWFDYYLNGNGTKPESGVEIKTQVCPYSKPSGGPYKASSWAKLTPGEIRLSSTKTRTIEADGGDQAVASKFIDLLDACTQAKDTTEPGVIQLDFPVTPKGGFTLAGSPTVTADISVANGPESQVAARLLEVKSGKERLISRGVYRPDASGRQVFQLHGNGYHFEPGTVARIQLLPRDGHTNPAEGVFDYVRPSNNQQDVTVRNLDVRLPVLQKPGSLGGLVRKPLAKPVPAGRGLMVDYRSIGSVTLNGTSSGTGSGSAAGKTLTLKVTCDKASLCSAGQITVKGKGKLKGLIAKDKAPAMMQGASKTVKLNLTGNARKALKRLKKGSATVQIKGAGQTNKGSLTIKRTGRIR